MQSVDRANRANANQVISKTFVAALLLLSAGPVSVFAQNAGPVDGDSEAALTLGTTGELNLLGRSGRDPFHATPNEIRNARLIELPGTPTWIALWTEVAASRQSMPFYAISLEGDKVGRVHQTSYVLRLRHGNFDPAVAAPPVAAALSADRASNLYIVQFVTQPLEAYRQILRDQGATVLTFMANNAHVVRMPHDVRDAVEALPFVRWAGPMHPEYRIEEQILGQLESGLAVEPRRYSIMLFERGNEPADRVAQIVRNMGAQVHGTAPIVGRLEATLTLDQVAEIAALDDVMFIDRKGEMEPDMDVAREIGGANFIENTLGFTGQGVRAEVADTELDVTHQEWSAAPIIHVNGASVLHGTSVYGILFAQGFDPQARGLIPDGVGIFAYSGGILGGGPSRYQHTAELVDPVGPYRTVLQTNSTGDPRTTEYTTISAEMDTLLFDHDILICQSQSNAGNRDSRPQAWAKNIVSGGGIRHFNTIDKADDCWGCGATAASIGPASDGRVKPDLCHFYDLTYAPESGGVYTEFGGTSGATPIIAGHFGLAFQMWHEQVFFGFGGGPTVFDSRPHMTTIKAMMINTAIQYPFTGQGHDLTRVHQGWGMPNIENLYSLRDSMLIVNETDLLTNLASNVYVLNVAPAEPALRATLVFADPAGNVASSVDRINDLTLKVTSPSNVIYWGNNGLLDAVWSTPGGSANTVDTVENVFVENPETGSWTVEVFADEVNQDGHVETPQLDADYALVVSGVTPELPPLVILLPNGAPATVPPLTPTNVLVRILDGAETLQPASPTLHYRLDPGDSFTSAPLVPLGGDEYSAVLPGIDCTASPEFYVSAQGNLGSDVFNPATAPLSVHSTAPVVESTYYTEDFESSVGWTVQDTALLDGSWEIGIPVNNDRGDPPTDYDGSGNCFLTDNDPLDPNSDVDGGPTSLISPTIDLQGAFDPQLSYARWFTNDDSDADSLVVEISNNNGAIWNVIEVVPNSSGWVLQSVRILDFVAPLTNQMRLRFSATDNPNDSVTEAALDAVSIVDLECVSEPCIRGDVNLDGGVDGRDANRFIDVLFNGGSPGELCAGDLELVPDGAIDEGDIDAFVSCLLAGGC